MTIDFGAHLYPAGTLPEPLAEGPLGTLLGPLLTEPERLLSAYEGTGIDRVVLSQPFYMGHGDVETVAAANDALRSVIDEHSAFEGLAAIPVSAGGEPAAREFRRALEAGFVGGALETRTDGIELTDESLGPVFDVAERAGAPVLVHPTLDDSLHPAVLSDEWRLNAIFGREAALSESLSKVIHEGVLDRHPQLTLVYHHFGGNIAAMLGRVHLQLAAGRWPGQERVKPWTAFVQQLRDRIYLDTSGFFGYEAPLRAALAEFPAERILFGTDYPFEPRDGDELSRLVETVDRVAGDDAPAIRSGNAERLFR